jgi:hypothetical protein
VRPPQFTLLSQSREAEEDRGSHRTKGNALKRVWQDQRALFSFRTQSTPPPSSEDSESSFVYHASANTIWTSRSSGQRCQGLAQGVVLLYPRTCAREGSAYYEGIFFVKVQTGSESLRAPFVMSVCVYVCVDCTLNIYTVKIQKSPYPNLDRGIFVS